MHDVIPGRAEGEVYQGKNSEEVFCEYRLGLMSLASVLRPQRSALDKRSHRPLSVADSSVPLGGGKQGIGRGAYQNNRVIHE